MKPGRPFLTKVRATFQPARTDDLRWNDVRWSIGWRGVFQHSGWTDDAGVEMWWPVDESAPFIAWVPPEDLADPEDVEGGCAA
jgi:hypothetical protein